MPNFLQRPQGTQSRIPPVTKERNNQRVLFDLFLEHLKGLHHSRLNYSESNETRLAALPGHVREAVESMHGNHVIQKFVDYMKLALRLGFSFDPNEMDSSSLKRRGLTVAAEPRAGDIRGGCDLASHGSLDHFPRSPAEGPLLTPLVKLPS